MIFYRFTLINVCLLLFQMGNLFAQPTVIDSSNIIKKSFYKDINLTDSIFIEKTWKKLHIHSSGNISVGYDYGLIPFAYGINSPTGLYKSEGNMNVEAASIPLNISYYYSGLQNVYGLNNYLRVTFDAPKYKEMTNAKMSTKSLNYQKQLDELYLKKQQAEQKLMYFQYLEELKLEPHLPGINIPDVDFDIPDSLGKFEKKVNIPGLDSGSLLQKPEYSINKNLINKPGNIQGKVMEYQQQIEEYDEKIKETQKLIDAYKNYEKPSGNLKPYKNKTDEWLHAVKKFEAGLCYPDYSTFLLNGAPIKGINIELEKSGLYVAFTHGKTVQSIMFANNAVQNTLLNKQNLFNFFDFNQNQNGRRITALKFGKGTKEGTHLFVGLLYGVGNRFYRSDTNFFFNNNLQEKNYVGEVDGKWAVNSNHAFDFIYGKSSLQSENQFFSDNQKGFNALFYPERSNAAMGRYTGNITKTNTKLKFTVRWIDPFFKSFGVGFMRPDNFRYELKADQKITPKIKLGVLYRKDEDNLLSLYYYKSTIQTIGTSVSWKIYRNLAVRMSYNPVVQHIYSSDQLINNINKNNISNVVVTYSPKIKKNISVFNALYSYYNLSAAGTRMVFKNFTFSNSTGFGSAIRNSATASWFFSENPEWTANKTILVTDEFSFNIKHKASFTIGGKWAHNNVFKNQIGFITKINVPLIKHFNAEVAAEKIIAGDFYNNYNVNQMQNFPYYCYGKIIYSW